MSLSSPATSKNDASTPPYRQRADCFEKSPAARLRPVPEWNCLLAYTPHKPAIHYLNPVAWVVVELCDGSSGTQIYATFKELNKGRISEPELQEAFESAMSQLLAGGLVAAA
ncbi:hypothetical protein [Streptomyces sp. V4I2]|uniref:hypothetical protein n=1 Tax=Streptomyces sp. V4I2 TaxID=3042280 RepID=UPI00278A93F3|nr:hypothetical protein [Streptomyces sp. V4I2]MDQ1049652.1 hypothetical protein [Streptomyces sp. V4I2]